jgi:hypothetical protein
MSEPRASLTRSHFAGSASLLPRLAFHRTPWLRSRYGYRIPASCATPFHRVPLLGTSHSSTACSCLWARSASAAQHLHTPPASARHRAHARATRLALLMFAPAPPANCLSVRSPRAASSARPQHQLSLLPAPLPSRRGAARAWPASLAPTQACTAPISSACLRSLLSPPLCAARTPGRCRSGSPARYATASPRRLLANSRDARAACWPASSAAPAAALPTAARRTSPARIAQRPRACLLACSRPNLRRLGPLAAPVRLCSTAHAPPGPAARRPRASARRTHPHVAWGRRSLRSSAAARPTPAAAPPLPPEDARLRPADPRSGPPAAVPCAARPRAPPCLRQPALAAWTARRRPGSLRSAAAATARDTRARSRACRPAQPLEPTPSESLCRGCPSCA